MITHTNLISSGALNSSNNTNNDSLQNLKNLENLFTSEINELKNQLDKIENSPNSSIKINNLKTQIGILTGRLDAVNLFKLALYGK